MNTTRILWSGLTGRTGREAIVAARSMPDVRIVAGMKRNVTGADGCHPCGELFEGVVKWHYYSWLSEHRVEKPKPKAGSTTLMRFGRT